MAWHKVAEASKVAAEGPLRVEIEGEDIALFDVEGEVYATANICTHAYSCLHEGYFEGHTIECVLHQGVFDVKTGEPISGPIQIPLRTFPTKVEDGHVFLEIV